MFGNRAPNGFKKLGILGKGSGSVIWLAENKMTGENVALKQYPKNDMGQVDEKAKVELEFYDFVFNSKDKSFISESQIQTAQNSGLQHIINLQDHFDEYKDLWLCYDVGKRTLLERLFTLKEVPYKGETIYNMKHQFFYKLIQ